MSVAPMYEPPPGISPAEAGTLLDDTIHPRDITSTIVDLAVRGYIKIEETVEKGLVFTHKDYVFHLLKPMAQWTTQDLAPHERVMLENIFQGGAETRLSSLKNRFYTAVPIIRQDIMSALKNKGIYLLDPESANGYSIGAAIAILIPFGIFQYLGWVNFLQLDPAADRQRADLGGDLVAVCARDDGQDREGRTRSRRRARLPGIHESRGCATASSGCRPTRSRNFCPTRWRSASSITGRRPLPGSSKIRPAGMSRPGAMCPDGFNPIFFSSSMHSMATDMHQVFVSAPRASSSGSGFGGSGGSGAEAAVLRRRLRRRRRKRVLARARVGTGLASFF